MGQTADWVNSPEGRDTAGADDYTPSGYAADAGNMALEYGSADATETYDTVTYGYTPGPDAATVADTAAATSEGDQIEGAEEIRAEIEQTRSDMAETINAIQEKLSPQNLVGQAKDSIREATVGRVEQMISNVGDKVGEMAGQAQGTVGDTAGGLLDTIKQNPLQAAIAGASLAWLFMKGNNGSRGGDQIIQNVQGAVGGVASGASNKVGEIAGGAQDQFQRTLLENPLVVGAAALALGAAVGLAVPETPHEHKLMGQARDNLVEKAQGVAQDTMQKVQRVAEEVTDTVKETVQTQAESQGLVSNTA